MAIVLSFLVFFIWNALFVDKEAVQAPPEKTGTVESQPAQTPYVPQPEKPDPSLSAPETDSRPAAVAADTPSRTIQVNTSRYSVRISEQGAVFKSFVLNDYKQTIAEDSPRLDLIIPDKNSGSVALGFGDKGLEGWEKAIFSADVASDVVTVGDQSQIVAFTWISPQGVAVDKIYTFRPDDYLIDLKVKIRNGSASELSEFFSLSLTKFSPENKATYGFQGASALINGKLEQIDSDDIKEKSLYTGKIGWTAVQDRYFMSNIIAVEPVETSFRLSWDEKFLLESQYIQPLGIIAPGTQKAFDYHLYFGPKSLKILSGYEFDLDQAIYFGWFDVIAKPCVWVMNFIYGFIPNYGVAIIILTLLIKMILWPLGNKSYKSMAEMKKIQPLVAELREKYKSDKKKMNEEMMKLYRVYKVNPMGGCLPMALQIPVFFALYRMLYESIELRHAPFFGWINDLSAPDRLFNFGFSIPFMEPPYGIPVLTIIMGATMLLQQKMSPPPGDPAQAKMMMLMPIVFTVIFINFSSGLVLYWMVSNVLSIGQQYYVQQKKA